MIDQDAIDKERLIRTMAINLISAERGELELRHGQVWSTEEVRTDFEIIGFASPFAVVRRRSDNVLGTLEFQHSPRYYFLFMEHKK